MLSAAYLRYSSDRQRQDSTTDQLALLTRLATDRGLPPPVVYLDEAISGTHTHRPGLQRLLADATNGKVQVLLIEDLSRLARDLGDTDRLVKRLAYAGVRILGADGFDSATEFAGMQVGLRGIMDEHYIRDLARRTHRGQAGAATRGHHTGGRAYGYRSEPILGDDGQPQGARRIVYEPEAIIVRRIFSAFAGGHSVYGIVRDLNADGIPGPRGTPWTRSAIYPDPKRPGVGLLGNPLYRGEIVWNRTRWVKAPGSRTRKPIARPRAEWMTRQDQALVIVTQAQWEAAQAQIRRHVHRPGSRGAYLLSGLLRCGTCGGTYVAVNNTRLGCSRRKESGPAVCAQDLTLDRARTERALLDYVRRDLVTPEATAYFCAELARLHRETAPDLAALRRQVQEADTRARNILRAIEAGIFTDSTAAALHAAESDRDRAQRILDAAAQPAAQQIDARLLHRRLVAQLGQIEDVPAARQALAGILGEVLIVATDTGPVARIDQGRAVAALIENSGSGGVLRAFSSLVEIPL